MAKTSKKIVECNLTNQCDLVAKSSATLPPRNVAQVTTECVDGVILSVLPCDDLAKRGLVVTAYTQSEEQFRVIVANVGKEIIPINDGDVFAIVRTLA